MKSLIKKAKPLLFLLSTSFALSFLSLNGQQISTVAEIYNYDVGDIFHVREFGSAFGGGFEKQFSYEILSKYYSTENDTVFYSRHVKTALTTSDDPGEWFFDDYQDTVFYANLDSLINNGVIDTVFSDSDMYNGRIVNYHHYELEYYYGSDTYIEGCGGSYLSTYDVEQNIDHTLELKYFKKGDEEWGTQLMVSTGPLLTNNKNLIVYPNPFHSLFKIDLTNSDSKDCQAFIINVCGNQINNFPLKANQLNIIDLPNLPKGLYILQISGKIVHNQLILKQ